jgi:uncharacterized damage-inducible protein DinB
MKNLLLNYTRYNLWANQRVCDFIKTLPDEQWDKEITSSFSSLRKTIFHFFGAQALWLQRLQGHSPVSFPDAGSFSKEELMKELMDTSKQLIEFINTSSDAFLQTGIQYKNLAGDSFQNTVADILQHVINHSTFHRGQVITLLRQLGHTKLFATDYIAFCRE